MQNYSVNSFWTYRLEIFECWNYENWVYFQGVINQFDAIMIRNIEVYGYV